MFVQTERLGQFTIFVDDVAHGDPVTHISNTTVCHHFEDVISSGGNATMSCDKPVTGRHVYIVRDDFAKVNVFQSYHLQICEAIIQGYKPIGK